MIFICVYYFTKGFKKTTVNCGGAINARSIEFIDREETIKFNGVKYYPIITSVELGYDVYVSEDDLKMAVTINSESNLYE